MTSSYEAGRRIEYAVRSHLKSEGYFISRASSSKGDLGDVIAVKEGQVLFVNVKRTTPPGPAERADLIRVAKCLPRVGVPLVALGPASQLTFRRLTGPGPRQWVPWHADQIAPTLPPAYRGAAS